MTVDELTNVLNEGITVLQENKKFVTPELLGRIESILQQIEGHDWSSFPAINRVLEVLNALVEHEKKLTQTDFGDSLIEMLTKIQNRPVVMRVLSRML